jgi:phosphatidylinositol 4-kinase A
MGASLAEQFGKAIGPVQRHLGMLFKAISLATTHTFVTVSLGSLSTWPLDGAKTLAGQIGVKSFYAGEAAGIRLSTCWYYSPWMKILILTDTAMEPLANPPPQNPPPSTMDVLRRDMYRASEEIKSKKSVLTVHDLRRLLYRCAAVLISQKEVRHQLVRIYGAQANQRVDLIRP